MKYLDSYRIGTVRNPLSPTTTITTTASITETPSLRDDDRVVNSGLNLSMIERLQLDWGIPVLIVMSINLVGNSTIVKDKNDVGLLLLFVAPIFFFVFFWEPQLWLPGLVAVIFKDSPEYVLSDKDLDSPREITIN
ncbi:MAG: hypothetical protein GF411_00710 [Candidatus Lokiarchaeota archaeon]|nr:hypothetical protein [Candidatus Lokiarchaeota archaeon]